MKSVTLRLRASTDTPPTSYSRPLSP